MEYDTKTYFEEYDEDAVNGFAIIGRDEKNDRYHIAEKWHKDNPEKESKWLQYHIPAAQLHRRVKDGSCKPKAELTQEQFEAVCDKVSLDGVTAEASA